MARLRKEMGPHFLTDKTLKILHGKKIFTVTDFLDEDPDKLSRATSLDFMNINEFRNVLITKFGASPINAKEDFEDIRDCSALISCGIPQVDALLQGGILTGELTEICGLSGSGKTQFCHTIAASVALQLKQIVYYIDCKNDFSGTRMQSILDSHGVKDDDLGLAMEKIQVVRPTSAFQLLSSLPKLTKDIACNRDPQKVTRLVIVDSLPSLFYPYIGENSSFKAFELLNSLGVALKQMACQLNIAVVMVNLATMWREEEDESRCQQAQELKPAFGKLWLSVPNLRLCLIRDEVGDNVRLCVLKSTRTCANCSCNLTFSDKGLQ